MATNVVVVVVVGVVVVIRFPKTFFISHPNDPIVTKLCIQIGDNILHNRTVSDFQVKS